MESSHSSRFGFHASTLIGVISINMIFKLQQRRTFRSFESPHVTSQFIQCLHVLVFFHAVEHDTSTSLQVRDAVLEDHRTDCDASVHLIIRKVEAADSTRIYTSALLLELVDEFDGLNLGGTRDCARRENGPEGVEPIQVSETGPPNRTNR